MVNTNLVSIKINNIPLQVLPEPGFWTPAATTVFTFLIFAI